jgi:hypothetical protein
MTSCDGCGRPAWEHDRRDALRNRLPWQSSVIAFWLDSELIDRRRAAELLMMTTEARPPREAWEIGASR